MPKKSKGPHLKWRAARGVWEIVTYADGRRTCYSTGVADSAEAEKILGEYIVERHRPAVGRADPQNRLIGDILADYVQERGQFVKSLRTLADAVAALSPFWAEKTTDAVTEETCRQYCTERAVQYKRRKEKILSDLMARDRRAGLDREYKPVGEIKPSHLARELGVLSAACNHDYRRRRLPHPVPVWKPKPDTRKDRWLTRNEAAALIRAARRGPAGAKEYRAGSYLPLFILIGLYTGQRHRAILDLRWNQVDLINGLIDFHPAGEERTAKGRPLIKMPRKLWMIMKYARKRGTAAGPVIHENQRPFKSLKKGFAAALAEAGITGVTPHTMRHTAATWMTQEGVAFPKIARYIGHADSRTTERIYAHHAPDYLQEAADALDNRAKTAARKNRGSKG